MLIRVSKSRFSVRKVKILYRELLSPTVFSINLIMLHLLYIVAFTVLATLAIWNLVRNLITLGSASNRPQRDSLPTSASPQSKSRPVPHPELLDEEGKMISEPLLVMRSISVKDAREQLDALYDSSSPTTDDSRDE